MKVLERAGLVVQGREAQWRPRRLQHKPLQDAADWIDEYRHLWDEHFDRMAVYLRQLQSKEKPHGRKE